MTAKKKSTSKEAPKETPTDASIAELELDTAQQPDTVDELVEGTPSEREEAMSRAQACSIDLQEVLAKHRCRIMPRFNPEDMKPVGLAGDEIIIRATFFIAPLP